MPSPPSTDTTQPRDASGPETLTSATAGVTRAAQLLHQGQLVVVPTETVYGIAFSLKSPQARNRIISLKKLSTIPAWVIHVGTVQAAFSWLKNLQPLPRRLMAKSLPGPIAFQIQLSTDDLQAARTRLGDAADETLTHNALTLRCPEHPVMQQLLAHPLLADDPIAIIGAGTNQTPAAYELAEVPAETRAAVDALLDGGPTRYRKPSTLVRIEGGSYSVIRPGVIDERIIHRLADFMVLFVCSGNTCRSPMAWSIGTKLLADRLGIQPADLASRHIVVQSAGVHASRGMRATREAAEAVKGLGVDLNAHISQPATQDLLRRADVIYTMTDAHREEILDAMPSASDKTHRLDPEGDVEDPIGSGLAVYHSVAQHLAEVIHQRLNELKV